MAGRTDYRLPKKGAWIEVKNSSKDRSANVTLTAAACLGDLGRVQRLIAEGADVNRPQSQDSAVACMPGRGHMEIDELLLGKGADVNARTERHYWTLPRKVTWR